MPETIRPLRDLRKDVRMWASRKLNRSLAPPDWLSVNLTLRCNLSCVMCTTCYDAPEMSTGEVLDLIDQAASWGVRVFNPLGGEAFVRHDLEEILAHAAKKDLHVTLTTNATLITAERARRIAEIPPEKLHINISLDGPAAVHDLVRGKGSFKRAMEGYRRLREADAAVDNPKRKICCNAILHRKNLHCFPEFVDWLGQEGFDGVQVLNLFRNDEDDTVSGMWFDAESLAELERVCAKLPGKVLNHSRDLALIPTYYREGLKPLDAPCWAGWKELYVNADGSAIMCDGKLDFLGGKFGDVRRSTLRELWQSPELRARREVVKECSTPCIQNCYLRRESDTILGIGQAAMEHVRMPVRTRDIDQVLTLELCDVPDTPGDRKLLALFAGSPVPVEELYSRPERLTELRDKHYLDFGRGFCGVEVVDTILRAVEGAGLRFARVALRWRGEPLLHPEFLRVLEVVRGPVLVHTSGLLAGAETRRALGSVESWFDPALAGTFSALTIERCVGRLGAPPMPDGPAISWEGRVTGSVADAALQRRMGDALKEPFGAIYSRLNSRM